MKITTTKKNMKYTAKTIAKLLKGEIIGNPQEKVTTIAKIQEAKPGSISFLANPKYENFLYSTKASIVLISKNSIPEKKIKPTLIAVDDAYKAFATIVETYQKFKNNNKVGIEEMTHIHPSAKIGKNVFIGAFTYISENTKIGENTKIYPQVFIGENTQIGKNVIIYAGAKIYHDCKIGNNCIIHAGTIIGSDGFGFAPQKNGTFFKIQQIGNVEIHDNVEIGANVSIDRATIGSTIIKKGAKIDNLVQIAHNVQIGKNTVIASHTGISGSTEIGENCMIGGQVGFVGHIKIANNTNIGAQAGITKTIKKEGKLILGSPAFELNKYHKSYSVFKNLPEMRKEIINLKQEIEQLKKKDENTNKE